MLRNERGSVLIPTLVILICLTIMGMCINRLVTLQLVMVNNDYLHKKAFYAAESGISLSVAKLPEFETEVNFLTPEWEGIVEYTAPAEPNNPHPTTAEAVVFHEVGEDEFGMPAVILWGDANGDFKYEKNFTKGYPIEIVQSHGEAGAAKRRAKADIESSFVKESPIFDPNAALWIGNNLNQSGSAVSPTAEGEHYYCDGYDIVTYEPDSPSQQADAWAGGWGDMGQRTLNGGPYYPIFNIVNRLKKLSQTEIIPPANNLNNLELWPDDVSLSSWASECADKIYYYEGTLKQEFSSNNLEGCGILAINGNAVLGGSVRWHGIILVNGSTTLNGGGTQEIHGALLTRTDAYINGQPDFWYDCNAISNIHDALLKYRQRYWTDMR